MNDEQFKLMMEKLEEIRCSLIDVETLVEKLIQPKKSNIERLIIKTPKRWKCKTCGKIFKAGESGVFVDFGLIWCSNCTDIPSMETHKGLMVEFT